MSQQVETLPATIDLREVAAVLLLAQKHLHDAMRAPEVVALLEQVRLLGEQLRARLSEPDVQQAIRALADYAERKPFIGADGKIHG